jgi:hypothetical protein
MHSVVMMSVIYGECRKQAHYAECHYAECRYAESFNGLPECSALLVFTLDLKLDHLHLFRARNIFQQDFPDPTLKVIKPFPS